jgi:hypothetical protein
MKTEILDQDAGDHLFPETTSFGMTLKSTEDRDDQGATIESLVETFRVPGSVGIVDLQEAGNRGRRGLLVGVSRVGNGDSHTKLSSERKEETHARSLDTTCVSGDKLTKPGSGTLGTVNTSTGLALAIVLNNIRPLNTENVSRLRFGGARARNRITKGTGFVMAVKLAVKSIIPIGPVTQTKKVATSKGLENAFFVGHVSSLETANGQFFGRQGGRKGTRKEGTIFRIQGEQRGGWIRSRSRGGNITSVKVSHGKMVSLSRVGGHVVKDSRGVFTGCETITGDSVDSSNAREAMKL